MAFVGAFLGGAPGSVIAAGQSVLNLQWQAENRDDIPGATFRVMGAGIDQTVQASADGHGEITVPIGDYTVSVTHMGSYRGDAPIRVRTESQKAYLVLFDGLKDYDPRITALENGKLDNNATAVRATADRYGNTIDTTYATKDEVRNASASINITSTHFASGNPSWLTVNWTCRNVNGVSGTLHVRKNSGVTDHYLSSSDLLEGTWLGEVRGDVDWFSVKIDLSTGTTTGWVKVTP